MSFSRGADPIWTFFDPVTGLPLNDQYYVSFLSNIFPYLPSFVYQDDQGLVRWPDPIELTSGGALPPNVYFNNDLVYRIEVRMGPTQNDELVYLIENYIPIQNGGNTPSNTSSGSENQISNPQFAFINFVSPLTISSSGTHNIAPGWDLVLTGSGSCVVTQEIYTGKENELQNDANNPNTVPPYALNITTGTFTTATLRQRFNGVGAIWYNNYISASIFVLSGNGFPQPITVNYVPNSDNGGTPVSIISNQNMPVGAVYGTIQGVEHLTSSQNDDLNNISYVDIDIVLPTNGNVNISDIQVMGQSAATLNPFSPGPDETLERQTDHLFHYYSDQLIIKPKASILTAWNFALNPYQFIANTATAQTAQCPYISDQTILYQQIANNLTTGQASAADGFGLKLIGTGSAAATQFALIQYIDPATIAPYWNFYLSSLVRIGLRSSNPTKSSIRFKMRLIWRTDLPPNITSNPPIASWSSGGDPVFNTGWTQIKPLNDPTYTIPTSYSTYESGNAFSSFAFDQFPMPPASTDTMTLGVVLYTIDNLIVSSGDYIVVDKISLVPNKFAVDTNPITFDECLRQCQYYYESSYVAGGLVGTSTPDGQQFAITPLGGDYSSTILYKTTLIQNYKQVKRAIPVLSATSGPSIRFYSPDGTADNIQVGAWTGSTYFVALQNVPIASNWTALSSFQNSIVLQPSNTTGLGTVATPPGSAQGQMFWQYVADCRLGV